MPPYREWRDPRAAPRLAVDARSHSVAVVLPCISKWWQPPVACNLASFGGSAVYLVVTQWSSRQNDWPLALDERTSSWLSIYDTWSVLADAVGV